MDTYVLQDQSSKKEKVNYFPPKNNINNLSLTQVLKVHSLEQQTSYTYLPLAHLLGPPRCHPAMYREQFTSSNIKDRNQNFWLKASTRQMQKISG